VESSASGLAVLAVCVLCLGFWVPHRLRLRQQLVDARTGDRFSGGLRVLAVAGAGPVAEVDPPGGSSPLLTSGPSVVAHVAGEERPMGHVEGRGAARGTAAPVGTGAIPVVTPAARASRLAQLERRAARARRRLLLSLLLLLATAAAWTVVGLGLVTWYAAAVPSALLLAVLVLGRVAVISGRRADARWFEERRTAQREATQARALANGGPYAPRNRARVTGHAVRPSTTHTQMIPRVPAPSTARAAARAAAAVAPVAVPVPVGTVTTPSAATREPVTAAAPEADGGEPERAVVVGSVAAPAGAIRPPVGGEPWEPVPVPLPTYVTKAEAPRRSVPPMPAPRARSAASDGGPAAERANDVPARPVPVDEPRPQTETLGLPLEQILARRRAAG